MPEPTEVILDPKATPAPAAGEKPVEPSKEKPTDPPEEGQELSEEEKAAQAEKQAKEEQAKKDKAEKQQARRNRTQQRFNELSERGRFWESQAKALGRVLHEATGKAPPDPKDFKSQEEFSNAFLDYAAGAKLPKQQLEIVQENLQQVEADRSQVVAEDWQERVGDVQEEIPDWHDVVSKSPIQMPVQTLQAIMESPEGVKIAYHYAKNPDEARALLRLPHADQIREITRLEFRVQAGDPTKVPARGKNIPAPIPPSAPPEPVSGGSRSGGGSKPIYQRSMAEYRKARGLA